MATIQGVIAILTPGVGFHQCIMKFLGVNLSLLNLRNTNTEATFQAWYCHIFTSIIAECILTINHKKKQLITGGGAGALYTLVTEFSTVKKKFWFLALFCVS